MMENTAFFVKKLNYNEYRTKLGLKKGISQTGGKMMALYYVKEKDIKIEKKNGYGCSEMLAGTYPGGVHAIRCLLDAGAYVDEVPGQETLEICCFTSGRGAVLCGGHAYAVEELSFFVPEPGQPFTVHAATDMIWTRFSVEQKPGDQARYASFHMRLPFFKPYSQCTEYIQDVHSSRSESRSVIPTKRLCRVLMGTMMADAEGCAEPQGCFEKGHPAVAQWNVLFGDNKLLLTVDGESVELEGNDFSYVPAGCDHSLQCQPGAKIGYIWFEHYVLEKDYLVSYPQSKS